MSRLVILPRARQDLLDIGSYVRSFDPVAARKLLSGLRTGMVHIATHPGIGRPRPDIAAGMRYLPVGWHLIFYQIQGGRVEIIRVIDGRRDTPGLFHVKT